MSHRPTDEVAEDWATSEWKDATPHEGQERLLARHPANKRRRYPYAFAQMSGGKWTAQVFVWPQDKHPRHAVKSWYVEAMDTMEEVQAACDDAVRTSCRYGLVRRRAEQGATQ